MFPEAYVKMLPPEAAAESVAEAEDPAVANEAPPPKPKKKRGLKAAGNAARLAAKMATKAKTAATGTAGGGGGSGGGDGDGSCGKCSKGCFVYGEQHPEFVAVGHLDDWSCDVCGAQFANPEKTLAGYENLYACVTFEKCDWIACGKSNLACHTHARAQRERERAIYHHPGDMAPLVI